MNFSAYNMLKRNPLRRKVCRDFPPLSFSFLALLVSLTATSLLAQEKSVELKIDWPAFLARHDPVWEVLPAKFDHGAFLGNGLLGTTIYTDGKNRMRFEIGRSDVTEHRRDNARLPIGGMILKTAGVITNGTLRTDLWNAEVQPQYPDRLLAGLCGQPSGTRRILHTLH